MVAMKVAEWVDGKQYHPNNIGWLGGYFNTAEGHTWESYLDGIVPSYRPYVAALKEEVRAKGLRLCGNEHQGPNGTPKFSDGICLELSCRAWGDFMAAAWSDIEEANYMDYYYRRIDGAK
jgi:hypothetical protein